MSDEAQQTSEPDAQPAPRRTAMQAASDAQQVAESAMRLAQSVDDSFSELSAKLTEMDQRLRDQAPADAPTRDQVDGRISEAMQPLREELGGYSGAINRKLDEMRTRVAELEKFARETEPMGNPAADALAEDHISDQVEVHVQRKLDGVLARLEALERSAPAEGGAGLTWDAIAERVDGQARQALREAIKQMEAFGNLPAGGTAATPAGAHRKVLELMKSVNAIGKDRQTDRKAGGYSFRGIDDAMDAVGHAMREVGLVLETSVLHREQSTHEARNSEGKTLVWTTAVLTVRYTFIDPMDGSKHVFEMAGEGRASDDKATSKAAAMALKYGLLHALMIPVSGAVPDADAEQPQISRPADVPTTTRAPERTDQQRAARAVDAVRAIQNLHRHPAENRYNVLVGIRNQASHEGLLEVQVDTGDGPVTVDAYARSALAMLQQQQAQQTGQPSGAF